MQSFDVNSYISDLSRAAKDYLPAAAQLILSELAKIEGSTSRIYLCGNGGSGANAQHIENDISIGIYKSSGILFSVETLSSNNAVASAISNDYGYEEVFSRQLLVKAKPGDFLIAFSGSGNSKNILEVLRVAQQIKVRTCAVVGFDGGKAMSLSDVNIHFPIDDMQIVEDLQLVLGHIVMRHFTESIENR